MMMMMQTVIPNSTIALEGKVGKVASWSTQKDFRMLAMLSHHRQGCLHTI